MSNFSKVSWELRDRHNESTMTEDNGSVIVDMIQVIVDDNLSTLGGNGSRITDGKPH